MRQSSQRIMLVGVALRSACDAFGKTVRLRKLHFTTSIMLVEHSFAANSPAIPKPTALPSKSISAPGSFAAQHTQLIHHSVVQKTDREWFWYAVFQHTHLATQLSTVHSVASRQVAILMNPVFQTSARTPHTHDRLHLALDHPDPHSAHQAGAATKRRASR